MFWIQLKVGHERLALHQQNKVQKKLDNKEANYEPNIVLNGIKQQVNKYPKYLCVKLIVCYILLNIQNMSLRRYTEDCMY